MFGIQLLRRPFIQVLMVTLVMVVIGFGATSPARALSLNDAKAQGLLGEQSNGYLGVVPGNANAQVSALIQKINAKRRAAYQSVANSNGTTLKSVEGVAGIKLLGRVQSGQWFMGSQGKWRRR
jgi:uncharacterized protein YdbL (DUF1318 family)